MKPFDSKYVVAAQAWLSAHHKHSPFSVHEHVRRQGAVVMIEALEYHFLEFTTKLGNLAPYIEACLAAASSNKPPASSASLDWVYHSRVCSLAHCDIVAYLNRLGQFYYFSKAQGQLDRIPMIKKLMPLRMKHSAHRSIDDPRGETEEEQTNQASAFGGAGYQFQGRKMVFSFLLNGANIFFDPLTDHDIIMTEIVSALEACGVGNKNGA